MTVHEINSKRTDDSITGTLDYVYTLEIRKKANGHITFVVHGLALSDDLSWVADDLEKIIARILLDPRPERTLDGPIGTVEISGDWVEPDDSA